MDDTRARLSRLLEREHAALTAGRLSELAELTREKEVLTDRLAAAPPGADESLAALARRAEENARLLGAARRGLAAARDRLAAIRAGGSLETYDSSGRRARHGASAVRLERRA